MVVVGWMAYICCKSILTTDTRQWNTDPTDRQTYRHTHRYTDTVNQAIRHWSCQAPASDIRGTRNRCSVLFSALPANPIPSCSVAPRPRVAQIWHLSNGGHPAWLGSLHPLHPLHRIHRLSSSKAESTWRSWISSNNRSAGGEGCPSCLNGPLLTTQTTQLESRWWIFTHS